jgi:cephalosporin hydroxylase
MSTGRAVKSLFHMDLHAKTDNFNVLWLGHPLRQNVLDLWTIQETLAALRPELLIECGTCSGGSATFFAHLFDLVDCGRVVTIDVKRPNDLDHPRIRFIMGNSTDRDVVEEVRNEAESAIGPVMVILDSGHSQSHVARELEEYGPVVTPGSFMLVQDGVIDVLPILRHHRPGPLPAIRDFLAVHPEFEVDRERCERFLITDHPMGWLRRRPSDGSDQKSASPNAVLSSHDGHRTASVRRRWARLGGGL